MTKLKFLFSLVVLAINLSAQPTTDSVFDIYNGIYQLPDGQKIIVQADIDGVVLTMKDGDLLQYSDFRADSRVIAVEEKTCDLMDATIAGDSVRIARLFGGSSGPMDQYIRGYFEVIQSALEAMPDSSPYHIVNTVYRDEDSNYGFEDFSWGWETYVCFKGNAEDVIVRIVWDGNTGKNMHRGTGKIPPVATKLKFNNRPPSRSWIRVYDPESETILRVREVEREKRKQLIPARFIAYDISTHATVGIRFRRESRQEPMKLEIGPLGSEVFQVASRID